MNLKDYLGPREIAASLGCSRETARLGLKDGIFGKTRNLGFGNKRKRLRVTVLAFLRYKLHHGIPFTSEEAKLIKDFGNQLSAPNGDEHGVCQGEAESLPW